METIINGLPEDILVTSEWICKIHNEIAGSLFPEWAGRFRDVNVQVGTHIPPHYLMADTNLKVVERNDRRINYGADC